MEAALQVAVKDEIRRFNAQVGPRRVVPPRVTVGRPGSQSIVLAETSPLTAALRTDLLERAVDGLLSTEGAFVWVARIGGSDPVETDDLWFQAARQAFARHGLPLERFLVLHRRGWRDLVTGERQEWPRVRQTVRATRLKRRSQDG